MTEIDAMPATEVPRRRMSQLSELGTFVDNKISALQVQQLKGLSCAKATLAQLRRAVGKDPGSVPEIWEFTLGGVPLPYGYNANEPAPAEYAAHIAMTLYAVHQQSKTTRMHKPDVGLGTALRRFSNGKTDDAAVIRRFQAIGTANELAEIAHHARGLISQLRSASIPLDYGLFADQLLLLQDPRKAAGVRLRWGREFHLAKRTDEPETDGSETTPVNGENP